MSFSRPFFREYFKKSLADHEEFMAYLDEDKNRERGKKKKIKAEQERYKQRLDEYSKYTYL